MMPFLVYVGTALFSNTQILEILEFQLCMRTNKSEDRKKRFLFASYQSTYLHESMAVPLTDHLQVNKIEV